MNKVAQITLVALLAVVGINVNTADATRWDQPFSETSNFSAVSSEEQSLSQVISPKRRGSRARAITSTR